MICAGEGDRVSCVIEIELEAMPGVFVVEVQRAPLMRVATPIGTPDGWFAVWLVVFIVAGPVVLNGAVAELREATRTRVGLGKIKRNQEVTL